MTPAECPRGRELKAEWKSWKARVNKTPIAVIKSVYAYQRWQQHVDECAVCKQEEE